MNKETEEEFNNFMHKVTEVNGIVKKLVSEDKTLNKMGIKDADSFLKTVEIDNIDEEDIKLKIKDNKTIINKIKDEPTNPDTMSPGERYFKIIVLFSYVSCILFTRYI